MKPLKQGRPFTKKQTEQELEDLQRRREPENLELLQLTKDALLDIAKRFGIAGVSTMTKAELLKNIIKTKEEVDEVEKKNKEIKRLEQQAKFDLLEKEAEKKLKQEAEEREREFQNARELEKFYRERRREKEDKLLNKYLYGEEELSEKQHKKARDIIARREIEDEEQKLLEEEEQKIAEEFDEDDEDDDEDEEDDLDIPDEYKKIWFDIPKEIRDDYENVSGDEDEKEQWLKEAIDEWQDEQKEALKELDSIVPKGQRRKRRIRGKRSNKKKSQQQPVAPMAPPLSEPVAPVPRTLRTYPTATPSSNNIPRTGDTGIEDEEKETAPPMAAAAEPAAAAPDVPEQVPAPAPAPSPTKLSRLGRTGKGANAPQGKSEEPTAALREFGTSNHEIDNFLSKFGNEYLGCIGHDEIPSKIYPKIRPRSRGFFVINTDPSWKSGCHWQAVFFDARPTGSNSIEFFDSFADPIDKKLQEDLKGIAERLDAKTYLKLKENRIKRQNDDSDNCGHFCMEFICDRMRGKPFPEASGFDESVKGESDIHKWKKMNGFGFLPSFGSIAQRVTSAIAKPISNTVQRVKNVGSTIGNFAQQVKETIFFPEKKLPTSIQPIFEKYKNYKIMSCRIRREPILAFVDKFINLISF